MNSVRNNWTINEIKDIYNQPLLELVYQSATVHRHFHDPRAIQISSLLSIKTGGCTEDCKYCAQSSYYETNIRTEPLMQVADIVNKARLALENGSSRFCLSTAWRQIPDAEMEKILDIISAVNDLGLEVCATMGMLSQAQAQQLKDAGLHTYNHNLDTGENFYEKIISTRTYKDRLDTLNIVQEAGLNVCSGGILGMGESMDDRINMLQNLSSLKRHPESVPINILVPVEGTDIQRDPDFSVWDLLRTVACARIIMPQTQVRLSAGRTSLTNIETAFCFFAGANSIFSGDQLLTTPNVLPGHDDDLFKLLGLYKKLVK
ncbi:MAG: biotin synthase BioB [Spirochaetia bacterium]|nr:biotin synthase BioB [Spirochaetia bacterium]